MKLCALLWVGCCLLVSQAIGCGGSSDPTSGEVSGTRISRAAVTSGCHTVCATCPAGEVCPDLCHAECPHGVVPCGNRMCHQGSVCCNASCGICTPPGGVCTQQNCERQQPCVETALCIRGFHFSQDQCTCVPDVPGSCGSDDDCRLFADYCTGCDCRALAVTDPDPTCPGPGVQCFADPCMTKTASCVEGQCTIVCVQTQLCVRDSHWSPTECQCVPDRPRRPHAPRHPHRPHQPRVPHPHL